MFLLLVVGWEMKVGIQKVEKIASEIGKTVVQAITKDIVPTTTKSANVPPNSNWPPNYSNVRNLKNYADSRMKKSPRMRRRVAGAASGAGT